MAVFTNQAQLAYNDSVTNSNIAVGEILEVLSATKTAVRGQYAQNETVTYIVSIVNSGTIAFNGLTVTDNLGAYAFGTDTLVPLSYIEGTLRYYIDGVLQATPAVTSGPPLTVTNINVPANGNAILVYEARVNQFAPLGADDTITNTVTITGNGITTITAEETIETENAPVLTITKSISPVPVTENGVLTYTFVIQNAGNTAAVTTDNAVITDVFDPILSNVTVSFDGTSWTEGVNYNYDVTTGTFVTIPGQITVPAATYVQNTETGVWSITPGVSTLIVTGTI